MHARRWIAPLGLALMIAGRPAAAQNPEVQADATFNVGFASFSQETFEADPMADPEDRPDNTDTRTFTEIRPGIAVISGRPRLYWRFGYIFSGNFALDGNPAYSNQLDISSVSLPSKHTQLNLTALVAQGGTSFLLSQRPAETGEPELRAPGNPNLVSMSLTESLAWDAGRALAVRQSLNASLSAPQDQLDSYNGALGGSLVLERVFQRFSAGLDVRSSISRLRPLQVDVPPYISVTNGILARIRHDFTYNWNGLATAGVEQVYTDSGSEPLAILPSASVTALYTHRHFAGSIDLSHGSFTNIQVGTVSVTDRISVRGVYTLDLLKLRTLSFSTGFLHNEPIGEAAALVAAGTGNAIQADAGFTTMLTKNILGNARYTLAYQFGQEGGLEPILAHIFLVGVTARYSNATQTPRPLPGRGRRVDGSDGVGFPLGGDPVERTGEPPAP